MQNDDSDSIVSLLIENDEELSFTARCGRCLLSIFIVLLNILQLLISIVVFVVQRVGDEIIATEQMFLIMNNLYTFMCQFFYFTLCDITLLKTVSKYKRGRIISGLTTLLIYSIFTYFVAKLRHIFRHTMDRYAQPHRTRVYVMRVLKTMLEFGKAAIVIICLREQGLQYHVDMKYSSATFIYYICTEKLFIDALISGTKMFSFKIFDGLEHLYIPIILISISVFLAVIGLFMLISAQKYTLYGVLALYFTVYLPIRNMLWNYLNPLIMERRTFASFKVANQKDLSQWDDICAVCLERMSNARITPCNHLFHPQCLKRCLQTSMQCPLCKKDFIDARTSDRFHQRIVLNRRR